MLRSKNTALKNYGSNHADACQNHLVLAHTIRAAVIRSFAPSTALAGLRGFGDAQRTVPCGLSQTSYLLYIRCCQ